ncbi:MAG: aminotransferase class I/II-fold pyridoxal phosphate-dependent enzyme [Saprospirales bacterium]|nr:MAG: aminotransferase class I/II-fold pyridoxal phosphate-dependent enzyme [Saprospirales bacterium]
MINLISDTVTIPCTAMLKAMFEAKVGDDVFKEDPAVNELEEYAADLFNKEAAIFCPSGTMTNQIALRVNTRPLDEVICDIHSHIFHYENAAYATNAGVGLNLIQSTNGIMTVPQISNAIRPKTDWYPNSSLVVVENTCNKAGGTHYSLKEMSDVSNFSREMGLRLHLDGARIFNALVIDRAKPESVGPLFDTISVCLSKGLGAPVGSLLLADKEDIDVARRIRKSMGGGMRQAGYLAAAGLFALKNNIPQLELDHYKAQSLKKALQGKSWVKKIHPGETNIVIFDLEERITAATFISSLKKKGILCVAFGPHTIRFVTHRDVSEAKIRRCCDIIKELTFRT